MFPLLPHLSGGGSLWRCGKVGAAVRRQPAAGKKLSQKQLNIKRTTTSHHTTSTNLPTIQSNNQPTNPLMSSRLASLLSFMITYVSVVDALGEVSCLGWSAVASWPPCTPFLSPSSLLQLSPVDPFPQVLAHSDGGGIDDNNKTFWLKRTLFSPGPKAISIHPSIECGDDDDDDDQQSKREALARNDEVFNIVSYLRLTIKKH